MARPKKARPDVDLAGLNIQVEQDGKPVEGLEEEMPNSIDVIDYLKTNRKTKKIKVGKRHSKQLLEAVSSSNPDAVTEDRKVLPDVGSFKNEAKPIVASNIWTVPVDEVGDVTLTDNDKDEYYKAFLFDDPAELTVQLNTASTKYPLDFVIRDLRVRETELIFMAVGMDAQVAGKEFMPETFIGLLQKYTAACQLVSIAGKPVATYSLKVSPKNEAERMAAIEELRAAKVSIIDQWSDAKWSMVFTALKIFTQKIKLCKEAQLNGNF